MRAGRAAISFLCVSKLVARCKSVSTRAIWFRSVAEGGGGRASHRGGLTRSRVGELCWRFRGRVVAVSTLSSAADLDALLAASALPLVVLLSRHCA